jgi:transmembrane protein
MSTRLNPGVETAGPLDLLLRVLITAMFWISGLEKALDFTGGIGEMQHFGLNPPALYAIATIVVQLAGSALVIFSRSWAWLGAIMLSFFTILTIPVAHAFWRMDGMARIMEQRLVEEHFAVIAALIMVLIISWKHRSAGRAATGIAI